jgi:hypothetical protein
MEIELHANHLGVDERIILNHILRTAAQNGFGYLTIL